MNVQGGFQLDDPVGILRRRAKVAAAVAGLVALAAYWVAMALPNEYESYATVLVEPQAISPELVTAGVKEGDLTERLHLMTAQILSRPRLSRIIDDSALYQQQSKTMLREEVIDLMRRRVRVEPVLPELQTVSTRRRDTEINQFRIFFSDEDPKVARDIAQRLANDFIEQHIRARVELSQKSVEFVESELDRLATRIEEVEARVAAVKAANPGRLPEDMRANQNALSRLTSDLATAKRALAVAQSDEAFYRSQSAAAVQMEQGDDATSPERRVELLELALSEFKARGFTDKHPDVIKTKIEVEQIRERLREEQAQEKSQTRPPSFAAQSALAEADRASLRARSVEDEIVRLEEGVEEVQALLAETPAVAEQLDALEREYQHLFRSYQDFSNRRLEATVQAQLERRQLGEQFRVLESAFEAPAPTSPNRPLIVILGMMFGMVLGGGVAILLEASDSSVHSARQLQTTLRLPVLASIPEILLDADRAALRRMRLRQAMATLAVVLFALVGGAANYAWVNGLPGFLSSEEEEPGTPAEAPTPPRDESR